MIVVTFTNTNEYCNKRNAISFLRQWSFLGVIKGVNHITCWFTPFFAEREGRGLLYKIIKDLYQIISKLSEDQEVTDIIWYDILFIDNLGSNTPWKKVGQAVGQILGGSKIPTLFHNLWGFEKIFYNK